VKHETSESYASEDFWEFSAAVQRAARRQKRGPAEVIRPSRLPK
jgi:hypothetical protein